jgi:membrane protein
VSATTSPARSPAKKKGADPNATGIKNRLRFLVELFSDTAERFSDNEGYRLGAAFSYYATFSIFPLVLLSVTVVGFILGDSTPARERLLAAIATPGTPIRDILDRTLTAMQESGSARGISALIGIFTLLFGASGAFVELDAALNRIWCVPPRKSTGIVGSIRLFLIERLSGFAIVLGLGLTLLVSLVSSSVLKFLLERTQEQIELPLWPALVRTAELTLSIVLLTAVFTAAFHLIPRSRPPARVVVGGAVLTTAFLIALKEIFATYLSNLTSYSAYGVVGGVLALTTWIFLSSMIIFFGAQLTRIHAEKVGAVEKCRLQYLTGSPVIENETCENDE